MTFTPIPQMENSRHKDIKLSLIYMPSEETVWASKDGRFWTQTTGS